MSGLSTDKLQVDYSKADHLRTEYEKKLYFVIQ